MSEEHARKPNLATNFHRVLNIVMEHYISEDFVDAAAGRMNELAQQLDEEILATSNRVKALETELEQCQKANIGKTELKAQVKQLNKSIKTEKKKLYTLRARREAYIGV